MSPKADGAVANQAQMTGGIGQSVHLFGRTFHVQTEMSQGGVRTEVFLGGRLMAAREKQLGRTARGLEEQKSVMNEHHQSVVAAIKKRAARVNQSGPEASLKCGSEVRKRTTSEAMATGLRVRNLLREFRRRVDTEGLDEAERLKTASPAFSWIIASPTFESLRVDEQLRIHLLQHQIDTWCREGAEEDRAAEIRSEVANLSAYLAGIENRAEFVNVNSVHADALESPISQQPTTPCTAEELQANPSLFPEALYDNPSGSQMEKYMAKVSLQPLTSIDGFIGSCLVDSESGMMLGSQGGGSVNLELAAAGNTQVVRAKRKTMDSLKLNDRIEDILISLKAQYHVIRPLESNPRIFLYLVLDRDKSNLAMARHDLRSFEEGLQLG